MLTDRPPASAAAVGVAEVIAPGPLCCPRHAKARLMPARGVFRTRIDWTDLHKEPFRLFFPLAVLAGLVGVILWPLMLSGWMTDYPGTRHARLMVQGFFGGFIFGFLGTSLPRLLETRPLGPWQVFPQFALHGASVAAYALGAVLTGDALLLAELVLWFVALGRSVRHRCDLPPPGFLLVGMAFMSLMAGRGVDLAAQRMELSPGWTVLARLWAHHAFVLLCVLGAGGFLLPRFLGLGVREKFAQSLVPSAGWKRSAWRALVAGVLIVATYPLEAFGWTRTAGIARAVLIVGYLFSVMPLERLKWNWNGVQWLLVTGLVCLPLGSIASGWWPGWRVAMSHIEMLGGFGLITLGVASRVVFGHSGQRLKLERFHPGITLAATFMLIALLNRITGDVVPATMSSHYLYSAICWAGGLILWAVIVLPGVFKPDNEAE